MITSISQPSSQYQGSAQYEGYAGPATGAVGPPPRTVPCAHTVDAPALVQSALAGGAATTIVIGADAITIPNIR
jgi:hypothetical protein